jgi:hypothetical protein
MQGGTVSGRVALLLRSAEVKPYLYRFVQQFVVGLFPCTLFRAGLLMSSWPRACEGLNNVKLSGHGDAG